MGLRISDAGLKRIARRQNAQVLDQRETTEQDVPVLVEQMMAAMESVVAEHLSPYMEASTEEYRNALNVVEGALLQLPVEYRKRGWTEPGTR